MIGMLSLVCPAHAYFINDGTVKKVRLSDAKLMSTRSETRNQSEAKLGPKSTKKINIAQRPKRSQPITRRVDHAMLTVNFIIRQQTSLDRKFRSLVFLLFGVDRSKLEH